MVEVEDESAASMVEALCRLRRWRRRAPVPVGRVPAASASITTLGLRELPATFTGSVVLKRVNAPVLILRTPATYTTSIGTPRAAATAVRSETATSLELAARRLAGDKLS